MQQLQTQTGLVEAVARFEQVARQDGEGNPWMWPAPEASIERVLAKAKDEARAVIHSNVLEQGQPEAFEQLAAVAEARGQAMARANRQARAVAVLERLREGWTSTQRAARNGSVDDFGTVLEHWQKLQGVVLGEAENTRTGEVVHDETATVVASAIAKFGNEAVMADAALVARNASKRLEAALESERATRLQVEADLLRVAEESNSRVSAVVSSHAAQAADLQSRLDVAMGKLREAEHVATVTRLEQERTFCEVKLKAEFGDKEIERLRVALSDSEEQRRILATDLTAMQTAKAELSGQLAVLRTHASSVPAPTPAPAGFVCGHL